MAWHWFCWFMRSVAWNWGRGLLRAAYDTGKIRVHEPLFRWGWLMDVAFAGDF